MADFSYDVRIPKDRVAVLIGKDGEIKTLLEKELHVKLNIDSQEGEVRVTGSDAITLFCCQEIVKAIGRGFNPETAKLLMKGDFVFDSLNINEYAKTKNHAIRIKGRVIGYEGKSRKTVENLTDTSISVYGKTIGIIGRGEDVAIARKAIELLLEGSPHSNVYQMLERKKREFRQTDFVSRKDDES